MQLITALLAGFVFGLGLIVSGMSNPAKVVGFLDLAGPWDPSLAFVMAGAIALGLGIFAYARRRDRSVLGLPMQLPAPRRPDMRLVVGSALFGVGWGTAGICPGPAVVLLGSGASEGAVFVAAMLADMALFELQQLRERRVAAGLGAASTK